MTSFQFGRLPKSEMFRQTLLQNVLYDPTRGSGMGSTRCGSLTTRRGDPGYVVKISHEMSGLYGNAWTHTFSGTPHSPPTARWSNKYASIPDRNPGTRPLSISALQHPKLWISSTIYWTILYLHHLRFYQAVFSHHYTYPSNPFKS